MDDGYRTDKPQFDFGNKDIWATLHYRLFQMTSLCVFKLSRNLLLTVTSQRWLCVYLLEIITIAMASRVSVVHPSVRLLRYCDHIVWVSSKTITHRYRLSLFSRQPLTLSIYSIGNIPKFQVEKVSVQGKNVVITQFTRKPNPWNGASYSESYNWLPI